MWKNIPGLSECEGASKGQIKLYYTNKYKLHIFYYQTSCIIILVVPDLDLQKL